MYALTGLYPELHCQRSHRDHRYLQYYREQGGRNTDQAHPSSKITRPHPSVYIFSPYVQLSIFSLDKTYCTCYYTDAALLSLPLFSFAARSQSPRTTPPDKRTIISPPQKNISAFPSATITNWPTLPRQKG